MNGSDSFLLNFGRATLKSGIQNPKSQVILLPIQRVKTILNIHKNVCLGLIRPKVTFYECLGYFLLSVLVKQ